MQSPRTVDRSHPSSAYVPGIDGLRALAVLSVMLFHLNASALPGGFVGVDVFFVISGFVVTKSLLNDSDKPLGRFIVDFYARRFRRIVPALAACLIVTVLLSLMLIPEAWLSKSLPSTGLSAFFGLSNLALVRSDDAYFAPTTEFNPFAHTWSLAVEEQFYFFFPLLAFASISRTNARLRGRANVAFALITAASLLSCIWATRSSPTQAYYMLPNRFWELAAGAALALAGTDRCTAWAQRAGHSLLLAAGLLLIGLSMVASDRTAFPFPWAIPVVMGSAAIICALVGGGGHTRLAAVLGARPLVAIGLVSYSLYLWHWPVYTLLRWTSGLNTAASAAVAVVATAVLSVASYRFIEQPVQRSPRVRGWPSAATVRAGLALIVLGAGTSALLYAGRTWVSQSVVVKQGVDWYPSAPRHDSTHAPLAARCSVDESTATIGGIKSITYSPRACQDPGAQVRARLIVAGDSHVDAYQRLLYRTAGALGMEVISFSKGGCPVAGVFRLPEGSSGPCQSHKQRVVERLVQQARPGDIVWLANLNVQRLGDHWTTFSDAEVAQGTSSPQAAADRQAAEAEASKLVAQLRSAGVAVVFDLPMPLFRSPPFRCSDPFNQGNPICAPGFEIARPFMESHRSAAVAAIDRMTRSTAGVFAWDPLPVLCPGDRCTAFEGKRPKFFDGDHLSGYGNELLVPSFVAFVRTTAAQASRP